MYDVIIVGAGPAGATAAKELATHGKSVLLLEKMHLPRNKSCSGILINKTIGLVRQYFDADIPLNAQCLPNDNRGMVFFNEDGQEYRFEQPGLNIWRDRFDYWLVEKAIECGAILQANSPVDSCSVMGNGHIEVTLVSGEKIKTKSVIVCEGAVRGVKRKLLNITPESITTYQTFHTGTINLDPHYFYAFLQRDFSNYDAWFNVKDENLIIGVAGKNAEFLSQFHHKFILHLQTNYGLVLASRQKEEKWIMPEVRPGCPIDYGIGAILFAGEAAGFLNPMGEGISCGLESGHAAAKAVLSYLESNVEPVGTYQELAKPIHNYMVRQWRVVSSIASSFKHMA